MNHLHITDRRWKGDKMKKMNFKKNAGRATAILLAGMMAAGALAGCGGSGSDGGSSASSDEASTSFTWLIDYPPSSYYYDEYEDGPIYKYWSAMEWDADGDGEGKTIDIDFSAAVEGQEQDYINTLIATADYPDVMSISAASIGAAEMYEQGMTLDLTEYVENYMPNYKAWMAENPEFANLMTNYVDGEDRYIQIYGVYDKSPEWWCGFDYRRDWIVKYGTNPTTGEAFTGAWEGDEWVDDVVFPSGGSDPIYISDWEWMLDIFATALKSEGITDGYPMQLAYQGYYDTGNLVSGFGVGPTWYINDDGAADFGGNSEGFKAYLECMNSWYEKGWIDQSFDERSQDLFFNIDTPSVYAGKVGLWTGVSSDIGNVLEESGDYTSGIVVATAPLPINDMYGDKSTQGHEPTVYFGSSLVGNSFVITEKAADKDIATLLTAVDYLFSEEGGVLRQYGLSDVQQAEVQDEFYNTHGLENGIYDVTEEDGVKIYNIHTKERDADGGLASAASMQRVYGLTVEKNVNMGNTDFKQHCLDNYTMYPNAGTLTSTVTGQLSADQTARYSEINTQATTYMSQAVADFVTGRSDIDSEEAWKDYCDTLDGYGVDEYSDMLNEVLGK